MDGKAGASLDKYQGGHNRRHGMANPRFACPARSGGRSPQLWKSRSHTAPGASAQPHWCWAAFL